VKLTPKVTSGIFSLQNLYRQYLKCRRNKRNTLNALQFEFNAEWKLAALAVELQHKTYRAKRAIGFVVAKPKLREIVAADFSDRIVHHVLVDALETIFEPQFIYDSYACRQDKGTHKAVARVEQFIRQLSANAQPSYFLQLDIQNFFMNIDKNILLGLIYKRTRDHNLRWLAREVIFINPSQDMLLKGDSQLFKRLPAHKSLLNAPVGKGLPIGNLSSQFFANIYLNELDQFVKHNLKCSHYVRYCDDFILLDNSKAHLERFKGEIEQFLAEKLLLKLNPRYHVVLPVSNGINYLGYIVHREYRLVRKRVVNNLYEKLKKLLSQLCQLNKDGIWRINYFYPELKRLHSVLASYLGHFKHANSYRLIEGVFKHFSELGYFFELKWLADRSLQLLTLFDFKSVAGGIGSQYGYYVSCFKDSLLFFQVGYYYEFYAELPTEVVSLLKLRRLQRSSRNAYYGFPCNKESEYLSKVLNLGYSVVIIHETTSYLGRLKQRLPVVKLFKQGLSHE
jgi:retron-type reverse transcriptase